MEHAPQAALRTWHGCVVAQQEAHSSPRRRPRLDRTNTATGRWHELRKVVVTSFKSCDERSASCSPRGVSADCPRNMRAAQCELGVVVLWANAGRAPPSPSAGARPHQHRHRSRHSLQKAVWSPRSNFMAHGPRGASRPVEYRPTIHGVFASRSADLPWPCCGPTRGALLPTHSAGARLHQHRDSPATKLSNGRGHCI